MRCEEVETPAAARALFADESTGVERNVRKYLQAVRTGGDGAVARLTKLIDRVEPIPPTPDDLDAALAALGPELRSALELAAENIALVARAGLGSESELSGPEGQRITLREEPVAAAGIYAPGGRAAYPSSVLMGVVTARVAGVEDIALCSPPAPDGRVHPVVLAAARLAGATRVHAVGGAQAIGALAYGTETIPRVDVIAGPGNAWVTEAKRQVFGAVGIDGLAGPSDVVVIASDGARAEDVISDLLAQAEHGPGTLVVLLTDSGALREAVAAALAEAPDTGAVAVLPLPGGLDAALEWAAEFAPEHLELLGEEAEARAPLVRGAGCVFVGTGTAFGDYVAGSNHVLPTGGAARFSSGLSPRVFRRRFSEVRIDSGAAARLAGEGATIARAEGFAEHAHSMELRMRDA